MRCFDQWYTFFLCPWFFFFFFLLFLVRACACVCTCIYAKLFKHMLMVQKEVKTVGLIFTRKKIERSGFIGLEDYAMYVCICAYITL